MVTTTVSGDGWATSIRPPPVWAHLPLTGVTWPWRSYKVIDTGGAGAAPAVTVTLTAPPCGTTVLSWARVKGAARQSRPRAKYHARRECKLPFLELEPPCRWPPSRMRIGDREQIVVSVVRTGGSHQTPTAACCGGCRGRTPACASCDKNRVRDGSVN